MPQGSGSELGSCRRRKIPNIKKWAKKKKSLLDVSKHVGDHMCLARVLVAGRFFVTKIRGSGGEKALTPADVKVWSRLKNGNPRGLQTDCAQQLCKAAGVDPLKSAGLDEVALFQNYLKSYQIVIYGTDDSSPLYVDLLKNKQPPIYVFYYDGHYQLVTSLSGFLGSKKACHLCHKGYNPHTNNCSVDAHKCEQAICRLCLNPECQNEKRTILGVFDKTCTDCNITFPSEQCLEAHKPVQCDKYCLCTVCRKAVKRTKLDDHHCMLIKCFSCKDWKEPDHLCYVQRPRKKKNGFSKRARAEDGVDSERAAYFEGMNEALLDYLGENQTPPSDESDAEDLTETVRKRVEKASLDNATLNEPQMRIYADFESEFLRSEKHNPTLLIMQDTYGTETRFQGSDCAKKFLIHLMENKKYHRCSVIFHGFGNYDGFLLLQAMHELEKAPRQIIYRSGRILSATLNAVGIRFIDSYLFVNLPLAKMPKAFGIEDLSKGYFPYKFLRPENRGYKGNSMPPFETFDPFRKAKSDFQKLKSWYQEQEQRLANDPTAVYDLEDALLTYCSQDVTVLRHCMERFRENMMELFANLDPFEKITLPSYCNHVYRSLFMPEDSIAILPPNGYQGRSMQSKVALAWLDWLNVSNGNKYTIRSAANGQEVKIGPYYLDGYTKDAAGNKYALEFLGCYFHGHLACQKVWDFNEKLGMTMKELYGKTLAKLDYLEERGFITIHMWECRFNQMRKKNQKLDEFVKLRCKSRKPLAPRDALRGGRTNANYLYYKKKPGESIKLYDYTSLYPSCQLCTAGQWWPKGHPRVITHNFPPIKDIFGLIKGVFRPPKRLYFPVLPVFVGDKVLFGLCTACMKERRQTFCKHSDKERLIAGTFVSAEVQKALEKGYECVELHEIWHFDEKVQDDLFGEFMRTAYREKVEASGYPNHVKTEEDKAAYVKFYKDAQGVTLRPEMIEKNPARRTNGKATITNLWGFFCKNDNPIVTRYVKDHAEICKLVSNKSIQVTEVYNPYGEQLVFRYKKADGFEVPDEKCNVVIGAFTTCYGRLRLYEILEKLQERTLYYDTDSAIWINRDGQPALETGELMGDLTDEILDKYGPDAEIIEFISSGAKSYACIVANKVTREIIDVIQKLKGFRLCVANEQQLNQATLKDAVFLNKKQLVPCDQIVKYSKTGEVYSRSMEKVFRCTYDKRLRLKDYKTLPYGWVTEPGEEDLLEDTEHYSDEFN